MAYSNQIPRATDQLDDSQLDILNNFIAIQSLIEKNHVGFNLGVESGKHNEVTLPFNVAPTPTGPNESGIFARNVGYNSLFAGNTAALFWQAENNTSTINMTSAAVQGAPAQGFSFIPSGLLIKFGRATVNGLNQVIAYPVGAGTIPVFVGNPFMVLAVTFSNTVDKRLVNVNTNGPASFTAGTFDLAGNPTNTDIYYLAIGVGA